MISLENERDVGGAVMGVDEAGRGPLAGPVFAAAVHVPADAAEDLLHGAWGRVNDSKKLSGKMREALAEIIRGTPSCTFAVASADPSEIDRLNILRATHLAMHRAATACADAMTAKGVAGKVSILVDGLPVPTLPFPSRNLVKGDGKSLLIAAASILAKTARDAYCLKMDAEYPGYGFAAHKGYPTPAHLEALRRLGPCPEHRRSFGPVSQPELF